MRILFLLLVLVSCTCKPKAKFAFNDSVQIIGGFYKGQTGTVTEEHSNGYKYTVKVGDKEILVEPEEIKKNTI